MILKQLINKSIYGTIGYISSIDDLNLIEQYIIHNLPVLQEFKQIVIATNYKSYPNLIEENTQLWKRYFPNCILIDSEVNRGHSFGTADLDNLVFNWCKENNEEWLCKVSNDTLLQESLLNKEVNEADFYYFNGISYEDIILSNFDYNKIYNEHFYPQTNFYIINVLKSDYIVTKEFLDSTHEQLMNTSNYNNKPWEYIKGWSCENFLKECVSRNNLKKEYLLNKETNDKLCSTLDMYKIWDPSHKNLMIEGVCHFHFPNENIIWIS
jgi:hypothetical protein